MVLLALVVPFHQRGSTPMPYLCHLKAVQDYTSQMPKEGPQQLPDEQGQGQCRVLWGFPSNGCIAWGQTLTGVSLCVYKGVKEKEPCRLLNSVSKMTRKI